MDGAVPDEMSASAPAQEPISSSAFSPLALGAALGLLAAVFGSRPALAVNLENDESVFGDNCAACHPGWHQRRGPAGTNGETRMARSK